MRQFTPEGDVVSGRGGFMDKSVDRFITAVRSNCMLSDAKDNGNYSMCMLFLRLRNLFKWERRMAPWEEAVPAELLDWIAHREKVWNEIALLEYHGLPWGRQNIEPMEAGRVNAAVGAHGLVYGAGLGKAMKAVFYLARKIDEKRVGEFQALILGEELARELDSPFAMAQGETIYFRTEPFRYFLWDRVSEPKPSGHKALLQAMAAYDLLAPDGGIDRDRFRERLDAIVRQEMLPIIHHEVGELKEGHLRRAVMQKLIARFPGSLVELVLRAVKDVLADLHEEGQLGWIIRQEKRASFGFYVTYVEGLRSRLFPGLAEAAARFFATGDWQIVERARLRCQEDNRERAEKIERIASRLDLSPDHEIEQALKREILAPLDIL